MKSQGLGDLVEKITTATGIKLVVDAVSDATGVDCGCSERKEKWNNPDLLINKILNNVEFKTSTNESTEDNSIG